MKKDIEWLRHKLENLGGVDNHMSSQCEPGSGDQLYYDGSVAATERALDLIDELDSQEALSKDLPVVPAWFHEWWKDVPRGAGNIFHNIERFYNELYSSGMKEACNYISEPDNKKKLLNIIINESGYKVEEEQKYFVSSRESVGFWFLSKDNDGDIAIGTNKDYYDRRWESLKLTEEEIKDYDSRYWAFAVKVGEIEE